MTKNKFKILPRIAIIFDFILLISIVYIPTVLSGSTIHFNTYYAVFFLAWIIISIIAGKYRFGNYQLKNELMALFISAFSVWGLLSLFVISLEKYNKNYDALYRQILIVLLIEVLIRLFYYLINRKNYFKNKLSFFSSVNIRDKQWTLMIMDLLSVFIAFMIAVWIKPASIRIYIPNYYHFLIIMLVWEFIINLVTQKHRLQGKKRYWDYITPILRANAITLILLAILIYLLQLFNLSRLIVFGTILLSTIFELIFVTYINLHSKIRRNIDQSEKIYGVTPLGQKKMRDDDYSIVNLEDLSEDKVSIKDNLAKQIESCCPGLFDFLDNNVKLKRIEQSKTTLLDTQTLFNISSLKINSHMLLINRHKMNDFKKINDYLSILNDKMMMGGYVVGCGETINGVYDRYKTTFPKVIAEIFYFFHFVFRRVLPKLPFAQEINYVLTNGQNRTMSKTEILGRLVYSGFKIIDTIEINNLMYFIAAKVNIPYEKENPSYGPFISLKRVGKDKKNIKIYKLRTMHPYSEYIQDYVFEKNNLAKGGKLKNDFRITGWGKIFRKLWIDELPQFINFMRGDIKLVGVRALSPHYFNLYPEEFQEYRKQFKPGLLPPYYVDMPKTMNEIVASEKKYLDLYSKYKFFTDIKYASIIMFNIVFRGKRSS